MHWHAIAALETADSKSPAVSFALIMSGTVKNAHLVQAGIAQTREAVGCPEKHGSPSVNKCLAFWYISQPL